MILLDSNVLIDLLGTDQPWYGWSSAAIADAGITDILAINAVAIAEVAPRLGSLTLFVQSVESIGVTILELTGEAAFAAGVAFDSYRARRRKAGGITSTVLPDFFIGGQAQAMGATILTRDPRFYRAYFPAVPLITPLKDEE